MTEGARLTVWSRVYGIATWALIVLFVFMSIAHVVLTVLFYLGYWDQGFGYMLSYEWPAWLVTIIDASAALTLWLGYRRGVEAPWFGMMATIFASVIMLGRAVWMVFVPVFVVVSVAGSIGRIMASRGLARNRP